MIFQYWKEPQTTNNIITRGGLYRSLHSIHHIVMSLTNVYDVNAFTFSFPKKTDPFKCPTNPQFLNKTTLEFLGEIGLVQKGGGGVCFKVGFYKTYWMGDN